MCKREPHVHPAWGSLASMPDRNNQTTHHLYYRRENGGMTINEPTTIVEQVDAAVADAIADYGDEVDESSVHHGVAYGVCWVWYHSTDSEQRRSANEYWEAHFGESFQDRLRRPL